MSDFRNAGLAIEAAAKTRLERRAAAERQRDVAVSDADRGSHPSTEFRYQSRARAEAVAAADAAYFTELANINGYYEREVAQHETAQRAALWGTGQ